MASKEITQQRLARLRTFMAENKCGAVVVNKEENIHYFSGFRGDDTILIVTEQGSFLITDSRYTEQAAQQTHEALCQVVEQKTGLLAKTSEVLKQIGAKSVAFEGNALLFDAYSRLKEMLEEAQIGFSTAVNLDELRIIKDAQELELTKKAIWISDEAYAHILTYVKAGMSENEVAAELEDKMRRLGSERPAFTTIVASGPRGALPHGVATDKLINDGEFVTIDFGAVYKGYHSDITRTFCIGRAGDKMREVYDTVLGAQLLGLKEIAPGKSGKEVDAPVRKYIADAGYGDYFGHGLGHGVGLEIHELPRLSPLSPTKELKENMLLTDEPGIYLPGIGGVRIEDTVLVTADGCRPLTQSSKKLIEL